MTAPKRGLDILCVHTLWVPRHACLPGLRAGFGALRVVT